MFSARFRCYEKVRRDSSALRRGAAGAAAVTVYFIECPPPMRYEDGVSPAAPRPANTFRLTFSEEDAAAFEVDAFYDFQAAPAAAD